MSPPRGDGLLDRLVSRRLLILSGKGGVGKSTVGLAVALAASERGRRVLFVEIDAPVEAGRLFGCAPVGGVETELRPGLSAVNLQPAAVMDEYVHHALRVGMLARRVTSSPIYERFFAAAPGLKELMVMGKLMALEGATRGRSPRYDLIVVDAPATGHGLSLLKVPIAAAAAVPVGPVGREARRIIELLRDRTRTALAIVAIPEEMAVVEALELHRLAEEEVGIETTAVILNACHERRLTREQEAEVQRLARDGATGRLARGVPLDAALAAARRQIRRRKRSRFYSERLRRSQPAPVATLPFLFETSLDDSSLRRLAGELDRR